MCLNLAVNKTELAIKTIKECGLNIQQVADKLGVHRNQIHRWLKGNTVIRDSNLFEIGKMINKKPSFEGDEVFWVDYDKKKIELTAIDTKEESVAIEIERIKLNAKKEFELKDKLINYQEQEIETLKKKLANVKAENKIIKLENTYEDCTPDFITKVQMRNIFNLKSIERNIISINDLEPIVKSLNISSKKLHNEYFAFGKWFKNNDHPIDKLIDKKSLDILKAATAGIPKQAKLFEFTFGAFYLKFEVLYIYKQNFCMTQSICKINWATSPIIDAKNVILHSGTLENLNSADKS